MSEYADISIRNLSLYWFRNYLQPNIVHLLFSKLDYKCIPDYIDNLDDEDSEKYAKHMYVTTVQRAKERLDALGFSLLRAEHIFDEKKYDAIYYDALLSQLHVDCDEYEEKAKIRINKYVTYKKWINSLNKIIKYELENGNINYFNRNDAKSIGINTECDKIIYYSLKKQEEESYYGLKAEMINIAYIFRLILESCEPTDEIILDFTNLGNWAEDCIPKALLATENEEKTIVLVEGTSDKDILEFAMNRIYPHLGFVLFYGF